MQVATCYQVQGGQKTPVANSLCGASCQSQPVSCPPIQPCIAYACSEPASDNICYAANSGSAIAAAGQSCCSAATATAMTGVSTSQCQGVRRFTSRCLAFSQCGGDGAGVSTSATNCVGGCSPTTSPCFVPICLTYNCTFQVQGTCAASCGQAGSQLRVATCTANVGPSAGQVVSPSLCGAQCVTQSVPCPAVPCCKAYTCNVAPFTACTSSCGDGQKTAVATCVETCNSVQRNVASDSCTAAGVSCVSQTQPCTVCPLLPGPITYQQAATIVGQPVTIVGQPVTVFGQPVTIMGQPVTIQGQNQYVTVTNAAQGTQQQQMQYTPTSSGNSMPVAGRYYRDVYQNCMDGLTQQIVPSNYCGSRRSRHSIGQTVPGSSSQVSPLIVALSVCGGILVVVALVASSVVLVRRTVSKRVLMHRQAIE